MQATWSMELGEALRRMAGNPSVPVVAAEAAAERRRKSRRFIVDWVVGFGLCLIRNTAGFRPIDQTEFDTAETPVARICLLTWIESRLGRIRLLAQKGMDRWISSLDTP